MFTKRLLQECECIPYELLQVITEKGVQICNTAGRECYIQILKNESFCSDLPKPCIGFYADIRLTQYKRNSILNKDDIEVKSMITDYAEYKKMMTMNDGNKLVHVNDFINETSALKGYVSCSSLLCN